MTQVFGDVVKPLWPQWAGLLLVVALQWEVRVQDRSTGRKGLTVIQLRTDTGLNYNKTGGVESEVSWRCRPDTKVTNHVTAILTPSPPPLHPREDPMSPNSAEQLQPPCRGTAVLRGTIPV